LLLDRIVSEDRATQTLIAELDVRPDAFWTPGHFPGMPIMPGVLQLEALAQTSAFLTSSLDGFDPGRQVAFLMSMDEVKFRRLVEPGDRLDLEVELLQSRRGILKVQGRSSVDGERASEAIITVAIRERPKA
jgi:3-hydroxymyristoyl/3-hydroxydecanoyl-(acyl carrier protein) dehydratase